MIEGGGVHGSQFANGRYAVRTKPVIPYTDTIIIVIKVRKATTLC